MKLSNGTGNLFIMIYFQKDIKKLIQFNLILLFGKGETVWLKVGKSIVVTLPKEPNLTIMYFWIRRIPSRSSFKSVRLIFET